MKTNKEIKQALIEMETRKKSYMLDMSSLKVGENSNAVVYDTELIRKLEVTAATIHALKWVLQQKKKTKSKTKQA